MSKSDDKLSRLASFGASAGAKPAAAAVAPTPAVPQRPAVVSPAEPKSESKAPKATAGKAGTADKPSKPLLIRNVGFTAEDQDCLDQLTELLRKAGEFRPSISDLVRVALRAASNLSPTEALKILEDSRKRDGRRKQLK